MRVSVATTLVCALILLLCIGQAARGDPNASLATSPLWTAKTGDANYPFLANDSNARGISFNPQTGHLIVASRTGGAGTGGLGVYALDGQTGALLGSFNVSGITGGTFAGSMVGVADDGAIYIANLTVGSSTSPLKVYKWA